MSAQPGDFRVEDAYTHEEMHLADEATVKVRAWTSDTLAAFNTARAYYAKEFGHDLRKVYGDEWAKVLDYAFKGYAALIDAAAEADDSRAKVRRFPLPAWKAQTYLSRRAVPRFQPGAEGKVAFVKWAGTMARGWGRYGWKWIDRLQLVTAAALFECDTIPFDQNREGKPAHYTDHFTDLMVATIRRARLSRSKRVDKFERAFAACFEEMRESGAVPNYAPEWKPPAPVDESERHAAASLRLYRSSPALFCVAVAAVEEARRPMVCAQDRIRRALRAALGVVSEEERAALQMEAHALVDEVFSGEDAAAVAVVPRVLEEADTGFSEGADAPTSRAPAQSGNCDFAAESEETPPAPEDKMSAGTPATDCVEFEPEEEPRGIDLSHARLAVAACASVGIERVKVVFVDDTKPDGHAGRVTDSCGLSLSEFDEAVAQYLERSRASACESLTVRIRFKGDTRWLQVDDCTPKVAELLAPFSFLQVATSPGSYQSWIAFVEGTTEDEYEEARFRLFGGPIKASGANGGAHGAVRWPGSQNKKPSRKYGDGESPRVQLLRAATCRTVTLGELERAGLFGEPKPKPQPEQARVIRGRFPGPNEWPDMGYYLSLTGGDRSKAEYRWCVRALSMGHTRGSVEAELVYVGAKAGVRRRDNYASTTVNKAASWLSLNPGGAA